MNDKILDIISKHTIGVPRAKTLEDLAELENNTVKELETLFSLHGVINWVAVEDKLPKGETKTYFVIRDGEISQEVWFNKGGKKYWYNYLGISHWMETFKPPCL